MKSKNQQTKNKVSFRAAVEATPDVNLCFKEGKLAILSKEKDKVELTDPTKCGGSLFIDHCLIEQGKHSNANRWDYAIDYNGEVFFFEVHRASSGEVGTVIKKLAWLKDWLNSSAPRINAMKARSPFYWVQSNGYHILPNSSYERMAIQKGLKPISKLLLK